MGGPPVLPEPGKVFKGVPGGWGGANGQQRVGAVDPELLHREEKLRDD